MAYYDVLLAAQQITVHEASVNLLQKELEDQQRRYDAGTVPHFNVLRAEVAVANERPALIQARNNYRITKNNLSNLLGYNLPREIWEDIPLNLTDTLDAAPYQVDLPAAIQQALARRTELVAAAQNGGVATLECRQRQGRLQTDGSGLRRLQLGQLAIQPTDVGDDIRGWNAGGQLSWDIFDGMLTHGKVVQAKALYEKSRTDVDDKGRQIELEVRTAYSDFIEAREVLESQQKVQEEADEALREAERPRRGRHRHATRRARRRDFADAGAHDANPGVARLCRRPRQARTRHRRGHDSKARAVETMICR